MDREPLRDAIRRELTDRIVTGDLRSGEAIPLVATADGLGVSMTPLRESLVQLELEGFVRNHPGRGYAVAELDPAEVRQVYPLIWTMEVMALASDPPSPETLDELEAMNARFTRDLEPDEARRLDLEWHRLLLAGCGNALLLDFLSLLKRRASRYELAYMRETGNIASSARQHDRIVERLRAGDLDGAAATLEENWRIGPEALLPWLERRDPG